MAMPIGVMLGGIDNFFQNHLAFHGFFGFHTGFHHHRFHAIFLGNTAQIGSKFFHSFMPIIHQFAIHVPIGIHAHANHIESRAIFSQAIKNEIVAMRVAGAIQMHNHRGLRIHLFHGCIACIGEPGILVHVLLRTPHRPKKAIGGFIAHLHPFHINAVGFKQLESFACVSGKGLLHLLIVVVFPSLRNVLFPRVSPPVAVVEINHNRHP